MKDEELKNEMLGSGFEVKCLWVVFFSGFEKNGYELMFYVKVFDSLGVLKMFKFEF